MLRSFALAAAGGLALGLVSWDRPAAARQDAAFPKGVHAASDNCRACHSGKDAVGARGYVERFKSHEFVLLNESITWDTMDPHSRAFDVLTGDLGRQMKENLGYAVESDARCLTCHATDLKPDAPRKTVADFHRAEGVSCAACHGIQDEWQNSHWKEPAAGDMTKWRTMPAADKSKAGMTDLRNPAVRAEVCAGCHVGDATTGKVVTHEMYAAGHPPLPPFELATFQKGEPPHWAKPKDLPFFTDDARAAGVKQNRNWRWNLFRFHPDEVGAAREVASGAIASLLAEVGQIRAEAANFDDPDWEGVDFARFDCYACHHDLQYPSDRQKRGYKDRAPGRPPLKAWVSALPGVVAYHARSVAVPELQRLSEEFNPKWAALNKAAVARPFGDPKALGAAADDMAKWCESFLKVQTTFDQPIYRDPDATKLSEMIAAAATQTWSADVDAAVHLTWAFLRLTEAKPGELAAAVPPEVRAEPFGEKAAGRLGMRAVSANYPARMKLFRDFKGDRFKAAFPK